MVTVQNSAPTEIVAGFTTTLATAHAEGLNAYLDYGNSNLAALDVGTAGADNSSAHGTAFIVGIRMTPPLTLSAHPLRAQRHHALSRCSALPTSPLPTHARSCTYCR